MVRGRSAGGAGRSRQQLLGKLGQMVRLLCAFMVVLYAVSCAASGRSARGPLFDGTAAFGTSVDPNGALVGDEVGNLYMICTSTRSEFCVLAAIVRAGVFLRIPRSLGQDGPSPPASCLVPHYHQPARVHRLPKLSISRSSPPRRCLPRPHRTRPAPSEAITGPRRKRSDSSRATGRSPGAAAPTPC